jgi:hypothetical protein
MISTAVKICDFEHFESSESRGVPSFYTFYASHMAVERRAIAISDLSIPSLYWYIGISVLVPHSKICFTSA